MNGLSNHEKNPKDIKTMSLQLSTLIMREHTLSKDEVRTSNPFPVCVGLHATVLTANSCAVLILTATAGEEAENDDEELIRRS
jgi:hypothetical protein